MYSYTQNLELLYQTPEELPLKPSTSTFREKMLKKALDEERTALNPCESMQLLKAYQIPTVKTVIVKSPEDAVTSASELGYPVVLKAFSPEITHKTKAGA